MLPAIATSGIAELPIVATSGVAELPIVATSGVAELPSVATFGAAKPPSGSNWDVGIHVDGVIRQRKVLEENPEKLPVEDILPAEEIDPQQAERDEALAKLESEVQIVLVPLYRDENGNETREIEFDGEEHIIGGFDILILNDECDVLEEFVYNCFGKRLNIKVFAEDGKHTSFEYKGEEFFVNVTSAYARAKDEGKAEIKYYSGDEEIDPDDIQISDRNGKVLSEGPCLLFEVIGAIGYVTVKKPIEQKPITIEAGTTVKNDDGTTLTDDRYTVKGSLIDGHKLAKVVINGSQTGVGQCSNDITTVVIENSMGEDVTYLYNITREPGKLQLVDPGPSNKNLDGGSPSQFTSTGNSDVTVGRYTPSVTDSSNTTNTTDTTNTTNTAQKSTTEIINGRVARAKVTHADGSVTYINVPFETSYGNDLSDSQPQVLGARRAATDDPDSDVMCRVLIILFLMGALTLLFRKNDISAVTG